MPIHSLIATTQFDTTNLCRKLIALQLVEKQVDEDAGRGVIYRLTELEFTLSEQLLERILSAEKKIFKALNPEEQSQLAA